MSYKYFTYDEFACQETGENETQDRFIRRLDILREKCGFPLVINSGYRSPNHSIEAAKPTPGQHSSGRCADIRARNARDKYVILMFAMEMGFTGIGVAKDFVHIDERSGPGVCWTY